jgi:hypothetical protein
VLNPLYKAAKQIFTCVRQQGWSACLIGGLAANRWGRPRATQDVDISLFTDFGEEERVVDALLQRFASRRPDAREFALLSRVLLINSENEIGIDVALAAFPFEEAMIERAEPFKFARGVVIPTAAAEDVIVTKAFANRAIDWMDIEGIMVRQRGKLDWALIESELANRCELIEDNEPFEALQRLRTKLQQ